MDLNTLNNKQLRAKCLEYGLPNVPVTDSSRKVLIKRLQNVMNPKAASPANRRKTIAPTVTTTISDEENDDITQKRNANINRRRTVAPSIDINRNSSKNSVTSKTYNQIVTPMEMNIGNAASSTKINDSHQRRSVSLSKTGVLTTSYSQETSPLQTNYEENGNDYEEMQQDVVDDIEMENIPTTTHAPQSYISTNYNYNRTNYNPGNFTTLPMPPSTEPSIPTLYPNLKNTGLHTDYYGLNDMLASHSSTARQSKLGFTYNQPTSYVPPPSTSTLPATNTRQTIGGFGVNSNYGGQFSTSPLQQHGTTNLQNASTKRYTLSGVTKRHTTRSIDDEGGASSSDEGQYEAPYLNKFSRNLETLKSGPPLVNLSPTNNYAAPSSPMSGYSNYSPAITRKRRTYDDNGISLAEFWTTLDQKYHMKQAFIFAACFIAAVFIYVFFLQ